MSGRRDKTSIAIKLALFSALYPVCAIATFTAHFVISYEKAEYSDFLPLFQNRLSYVYFVFARLAFFCGLVSAVFYWLFRIARLWEITALFLLIVSMLLELYLTNGFAELADYTPFVVSQTLVGGALALLVTAGLNRLIGAFGRVVR